MYKLLIVEDEIVTRDGLTSMSEWGDMGIEVCGEATNGLEALQLAELQQPDVILTDIRMPKMGGIELLQELAQRSHHAKIVVLSGYSDFEYARSALKYGAFDYLLKPCSGQEVRRSVQKALDALIQEQRENIKIQSLKSRFNEGLQLARAQALLQWVHSPKQLLEDRKQQMDTLGMSLLFEDVHLGIVEPDQASGIASKYDEKDLELLYYAMMNIVHESLSEIYRGRLEVFRDANRIAWIGNCSELDMNKELLAALHLTKDHIMNYLRISVSIGIGNPQHNVNDISHSYKEAKLALDHRFFRGQGTVVRFDELLIEENQSGIADHRVELSQWERNIVDAVAKSDDSIVLVPIEQWIEAVRSDMSASRVDVQMFVLSFLVYADKLAQRMMVTGEQWRQRMGSYMEQVPRTETVFDAGQILVDAVKLLLRSVREKKPMHKTVKYAIEYIENHYAENVSLESIASEVFLSVAYLSTLFKQEVGIGFLDYLHRYRVEKAKELLNQGHYKVQAVAEMVGYSDERRFAVTFKKWTGLTPSQYLVRPNEDVQE